jgi:hypothetical protein
VFDECLGVDAGVDREDQWGSAESAGLVHRHVLGNGSSFFEKFGNPRCDRLCESVNQVVRSLAAD